MAADSTAITRTTDAFAMDLVAELDRHCRRGRERISAFIQFNRQVEGWFKESRPRTVTGRS